MKLQKFLLLFIALLFFLYGIFGGLGSGEIRSPILLGLIFGIPAGVVFLILFSILLNARQAGRRRGRERPRGHIRNFMDTVFILGGIIGWIILAAILFSTDRGTLILETISSFWSSLPDFAQLSPGLSVGISIISLGLSFLNCQVVRRKEMRDSEEYQNKRQEASKKIILPTSEDIDKYSQASDKKK
jgi:hypothetical protein